jgi:hypothetical protein
MNSQIVSCVDRITTDLTDLWFERHILNDLDSYSHLDQALAVVAKMNGKYHGISFLEWFASNMHPARELNQRRAGSTALPIIFEMVSDHPDFIQALINGLNDPNRLLRARCAVIITQMRSPGIACSSLFRALLHSLDEVCCDECYIPANLTLPPPSSANIIKTIYDIRDNSPSYYCMAALTNAISRLVSSNTETQAEDALIKILMNTFWFPSLVAAEGIMDLNMSEKVMDRLIEMSQTRDEIDSVTSLIALGRLMRIFPRNPGVEHLLHSLTSPVLALRAAAADAFLEMGMMIGNVTGLTERLEKLCRDSSIFLRPLLQSALFRSDKGSISGYSCGDQLVRVEMSGNIAIATEITPAPNIETSLMQNQAISFTVNMLFIKHDFQDNSEIGKIVQQEKNDKIIEFLKASKTGRRILQNSEIMTFFDGIAIVVQSGAEQLVEMAVELSTGLDGSRFRLILHTSYLSVKKMNGQNIWRFEGRGLDELKAMGNYAISSQILLSNDFRLLMPDSSNQKYCIHPIGEKKLAEKIWMYLYNLYDPQGFFGCLHERRNLQVTNKKKINKGLNKVKTVVYTAWVLGMLIIILLSLYVIYQKMYYR